MNKQTAYTFLIIIAMYSGLMAGDLEITIGTGYDYFSSDYYLLTTDTLAITVDSLESLKRSSDATKELFLIGQIDYKYKLSNSARIESYSRASISDHLFRGNIDLNLNLGALRLENYFNLRNSDESETTGQDYLINQTTLRFHPHLGSGIYLRIKNAFEFTRYDNPEGYFYNYNYNKLNLALEKDYGFDGQVSLGYRIDNKIVSDSTRLEYDRHVILLYAEYSPGYTFSFRLDNEYYIKDSKKEDNLDDEKLENLELTINYRPSSIIDVKYYGQFEYTAYDTQDLAFFDQYYFKNKISIALSLTPELELSLTPHFRTLRAVDSVNCNQDFTEFSIEPGLQYMLGTSLWLDLSYEFGRRNYPHQSEGTLTDHSVNRLNFLFNAGIGNHLSLNLISAVDWERHDLKEDNTTLYLISSSIEYAF